MHKAMRHAWVQSTTTGRLGQVRKVEKDPQTGEQIGVLVKVAGDKHLSFWPTELVRAAPQSPSKRRAKGPRTWENSRF